MLASPARFVHLTTMSAKRVGDDSIILKRKFIEGMASYAKLWDGPVVCVARELNEVTDNLDNVQVRLKDLPFQVEFLRPGGRWEEHLKDAALVLVTLIQEFTYLTDWCKARNLPLVYVSELTWRTRLQIARTIETNPLRLVRRSGWTLQEELRNRKAVAGAAGIQCNGTPTFRAYQVVSPNALLYFDSRTTDAMVASEEGIRERLVRAPGAKIRLAFSGRLLPIKGVDHLVPVAVALRKLGVDFSLRIFGGGTEEGPIREAIAQHQLGDRVKLEGTLDFATELTPLMRSEVDLFVCCHRQGDPSCTYLETMSCGVPVVGYANEALAGVLEHADAGLAVPMDNVERLASAIASISGNLPGLERWSLNALSFARAHTFEKTFERRMAHARRIRIAAEALAR
jgi:colanic acid/amylovoran biosynthesis glycosyltransferase